MLIITILFRARRNIRHVARLPEPISWGRFHSKPQFMRRIPHEYAKSLDFSQDEVVVKLLASRETYRSRLVEIETLGLRPAHGELLQKEFEALWGRTLHHVGGAW